MIDKLFCMLRCHEWEAYGDGARTCRHCRLVMTWNYYTGKWETEKEPNP